jgi:hypothetical protein
MGLVSVAQSPLVVVAVARAPLVVVTVGQPSSVEGRLDMCWEDVFLFFWEGNF